MTQRLGLIPEVMPRTPAPLTDLQRPGQIFLWAPAWNYFEDFYGHDATYNGPTDRQFRTGFDGINDDVFWAGADIQSPAAPYVITICFRLNSLAAPMWLFGQGTIAPPNLGYACYINYADSQVYAYSSKDGSSFDFTVVPISAERNPMTTNDVHIVTLGVASSGSFLTCDGQLNGAGGPQTGPANPAGNFKVGSSSGAVWFLDADVYFVEVSKAYAIQSAFSESVEYQRFWLDRFNGRAY